MGFSATRSIKADMPECPSLRDFAHGAGVVAAVSKVYSPKVTVSLGFFETRMEKYGIGRPLDLA